MAYKGIRRFLRTSAYDGLIRVRKRQDISHWRYCDRRGFEPLVE
jgi:hypothetical protein